MPIINTRVKPDSVVCTDRYKSYDTLDTSRFHHKRINHSKEFANDRNHINGIENFTASSEKNTCLFTTEWLQSLRSLASFGIPSIILILYLKECEWRYNYRPVAKLQKTLYNWIKEAGVGLK